MKSTLSFVSVSGLQLLIGVGCFQLTGHDPSLDSDSKADSIYAERIDSGAESSGEDDIDVEHNRTVRVDTGIASEDKTGMDQTYEENIGIAMGKVDLFMSRIAFY